MFELIHESIWFASHMTFTKHFSPNGNVGDIVAKDDAQMSTAHLLGMLSGVGIISISHSPLFLFGAFAILSPINIWSTSKMLHAAEFEILNQAKVSLLAREYIDQGQVVNYKELREREIGFGEWIKPSYRKKEGSVSVKIKLGSSAEEAYGASHEVEETVKILMVTRLYAEHRDILQSILHSLKFHDMLIKENVDKNQDWDRYKELLRASLAWTKENTDRFSQDLCAKDWKNDIVYWNDGGMRLAWEREPKVL
ncbi:hypothetical protein BY458DRAFT_448317 [Sporodiniella umbellata]|nr:hypothetical protein BY458DRAFT_448317 [Sporodiniella umbellata]